MSRKQILFVFVLFLSMVTMSSALFAAENFPFAYGEQDTRVCDFVPIGFGIRHSVRGWRMKTEW